MCKKSAVKLRTVLQQTHSSTRKVFEDCFNGHQNQFLDAANSKSFEKKVMCKKSAVELGNVLQQTHSSTKVFEDSFNGHQNQFLDAASSKSFKKGDAQHICSEIRDRFATNSAIQQQRFLRTISMSIKISF